MATATTTTQSSLPAGYSASDLVFNDDFSGTTLDKDWHTYITSNAAKGGAWDGNGSGGSNQGGYAADYDTPSQVSVNNGLTLTATRQSITGVGNGGSETYPVTSGTVSSYGNFEFTGGYLSITMQAPSGDGAWPALWMLPGQGAGNSGDNYEIDMQEGGFTNGSSSTNDNMAWHLHNSSGSFGGVTNTGTNLTSGYNTYGVDWVPGKSITWYLNGKEVGEITSAQTTIPDEPMEVIMTNSVGDSASSSFRTALDSSTPQTMQMNVSNVSLYQQPGSGDTVLGSNVSASSGGSSSGTTTGTGTGSTGSGSSASGGGSSTGTTTGTGTGTSSGGGTVTNPTGGTTGSGSSASGGGSSTGTTTGTGTGTSSGGGTVTNPTGGTTGSGSSASGGGSSTGTTTGTGTGTSSGGGSVTDPTGGTTGSGSSASGGGSSTGTTTGTGTGTSSGGGSVTDPTGGTTGSGSSASGGGSSTGTTTGTGTGTSSGGGSVTDPTGGTTGSGSSASGGGSSTGTTTGTGTGTSSGGGSVTDPTGGTTGSGSSASGGGSSTGTTTGTGTGTSSGGGSVTDPTGGTTGSGSSTSSGGHHHHWGHWGSGTTGTGTGTSSGGSTVTDPTGGTGSTSSGGTTGTGTGTTVGTGASGGATAPQAPAITIANPSLSVSPGAQGVDLGVSVNVPNATDKVSVNIKGLPGYETITDKLDNKTFSGSNVTLTAAEVNSGLTLNSSYKGNGHPTSTLTVTATDQTNSSSSAAQSIAVTDPASTSATGTSGSGSTGSGSTGTSGSGSSSQHSWGQWGGGHHSDVSQWLDSHPGFAKTAKTLSDAFSSKSGASSAAGSSTAQTASAGDKAFALFNQMMAGDFGNNSHFTQGGSSSAQAQQQTSNQLTRPLH